MSELLTFLGEGRHVFSMCPECGEIHRLTELQLSRRGRYAPDLLDRIEGTKDRLEERQSKLEEKASELQAAAKAKAEKRVLPQLLKRTVPAFYDWKIDPRDVRTLIHPMEFVAFRGMNSVDGVREVTFLNLGPATPLTRTVGVAVDSGNVDWATLRLEEEGTLTAEVKGKVSKSITRE